MQASQRVATPMASAISSLVFVSSAFGYRAARAMAEKPFITSGAPPRSSRSGAEREAARSGQFLCMAVGPFGLVT